MIGLWATNLPLIGVYEGYWDKGLGKDDTFVAYGFGENLMGFFISHFK
jgi:hypothetical protein